MTKNKITSFTDLVTWQKAHDLVLSVYEQTKLFPKEERYSLTDQIRRASVSITSNIAEGFGRYSKKEKIRYYFIAKGSLAEVHNQLLISLDLKYMRKGDFDKIFKKVADVYSLIGASIKYLGR